MSLFGLTTSGWIPKPLATVLAEYQADLKAAFGQDLNFAARAVFGQLANRTAERLADLWDLAEALYAAQDPDQATGEALENLCALTGTYRRSSTVSHFAIASNNPLIWFSTTDDFVVDSTEAAIPGSGVRFLVSNDWEMTAVLLNYTDLVGGDAVVQGAIYKGNNGDLYYAKTGGFIAGITLTSTGTDIVDGDIHWFYVCSAAYAYATVTDGQYEFGSGPVPALAGQVTQIATGVSFTGGVINPFDATLGTLTELDSELRARRVLELRQQGSASYNALISDVAAVTGVISVNVLQNDTDTTDGNGVPPHSVECIVVGGSAADVRAAIFASKAAGTTAFGSSTGTTPDVRGFPHEVDFTRPTMVPIYINVVGLKDATKYPGDSALKTALVQYAQGSLVDASGVSVFSGYVPGMSVNAWNLMKAVATIPGIKEVTAIYIGTSYPAVASTDITMLVRQLAQFDSSLITITLS